MLLHITLGLLVSSLVRLLTYSFKQVERHKCNRILFIASYYFLVFLRINKYFLRGTVSTVVLLSLHVSVVENIVNIRVVVRTSTQFYT